MTRMLKLVAVTGMLFVALSFTFEQQAHAYVDPGSGLLLFQGISATISGVLFYFRRRIKKLFVRTQPKSAPGTTPSPSLSGHSLCTSSGMMAPAFTHLSTVAMSASESFGCLG